MDDGDRNELIGQLFAVMTADLEDAAALAAEGQGHSQTQDGRAALAERVRVIAQRIAVIARSWRGCAASWRLIVRSVTVAHQVRPCGRRSPSLSAPMSKR